MAALSELRLTLTQLITANHILDHHGLADAFGHVAVRDPADSAAFFMTGNAPAGCVRSEADLAHYRVATGEPVVPGDAQSSTTAAAAGGSNERFVAAALLARFPGVRAVVHSHSRDVVVAGVSGVPVRPMYVMAGFLGPRVPVADAAQWYAEEQRNDGEGEDAAPQQRRQPRHLLIDSEQLGAKLADAFEAPDRGDDADMGAAPQLPGCTVVLQRGHGFTTWGESIQEALFRAFYTQENVRVQMAATNHSIVSLGEISTTPLSGEEIRDTAIMLKPYVFRSWMQWSNVVNANLIYRNDLLNLKDSDLAQRFWKRTEHNRMLPF